MFSRMRDCSSAIVRNLLFELAAQVDHVQEGLLPLEHFRQCGLDLLADHLGVDVHSDRVVVEIRQQELLAVIPFFLDDELGRHARLRLEPRKRSMSRVFSAGSFGVDQREAPGSPGEPRSGPSSPCRRSS